MFIAAVEMQTTIGKSREIYFGKNYTIIRLKCAYKIALKYSVKNNEETKRKYSRQNAKISTGLGYGMFLSDGAQFGLPKYNF